MRTDLDCEIAELGDFQIKHLALKDGGVQRPGDLVHVDADASQLTLDAYEGDGFGRR